MVRKGYKTMKEEPIGSFDAAAALLHTLTDDAPSERVVVIYLGGGNEVLGAEVVAQGGLHGCALTPRDVFRGAFLMNASAIVIGHNHPSGDPSPSDADRTMTRALVKVGEALGVPLLDHVIVTRGGLRSTALGDGWING